MMATGTRSSSRWYQPNPKDLLNVLEVTRQMAAERDLVALLNLIMQRTTDVMRADRSSLFLVDRERGECWSKIAQGSEISEIRFPIGVGIAGDVAQTGKPARIADAYDDPRFNPEFDRQTGYRTHSVLCLPLHDLDKQVMGVLQVLNKKGGGSFSDYDEYLLSVLAAQAGVALTQAALLDAYVESQKLKQEMQLARQIQRSLLPDEPPQLDGFSVAAYCESADETGGDYYDFLLGDDGQPCGVAIGDVSGHGLPAALVMVQARAVLRSVFDGRDLSDAVARLNDRLSQDIEDSRFMTFFLGSLESQPQRRFRYCNAGHEPPLLIRPGAPEDRRLRRLDTDGLLLGILQGGEYPDDDVALDSGDLIFLCTDGIFEARNPDDELFGENRMIDAIFELAHLPPQDILNALVERVRAFARGRPFLDDLTLVIIKAD
jgi:phosphoserine phosphatase